MGVRRAFIWASAGRYLVMAINLGATLVLARLLAPAEYGVTVLGGAIFTLAEALRALGGGSYLIQKSELSTDDVRACFTVSLCTTVLVTLALLGLARPLAMFFAMPHLQPYLRVAALGYLTGPFIFPIAALLSRNMNFGPIAAANALMAAVNAAVSISLALRGFSYMSFAWAAAASTAVGMLAYLLLWKDRSIFRPLFSRWRGVLNFGIWDSATSVVAQIADSLPFFIFGRLFDAAGVAFSQRAIMLCLVPERVILAGVGAVALPAFSQQTRDGNGLRPVYLRAIELITAAQWPSLAILALLASPFVSLLLGSQWLAVVPFVQILAAALLFSFPLILNYPTIVAAGAIRYLPGILFLQSLPSLGVLMLFARHGLHAAILSSLVIFPWNGLISFLIARHLVRFRLREFAAAIGRSLAVTVFCAAGPAVMLLGGARFTPAQTAAALLLAGGGWLAGLKLTRHPLLDEVRHAAGALLRRGAGAGLRGRLFRN
jgi:O-antigen/teichoic acid export membrane protein